MTKASTPPWDGAIVATWLDRRIAASRLDQVAAERAGYREQDACDQATAEEMVCTLLKNGRATDAQETFAAALCALLERDAFIWRGVNDDARFDRHVRAYVRKLVRMTKLNAGFERTGRFQ